MEEQVVLCLGCGGLGCSVALGCARLGVKHLILVDYDVVESHNLNRQLLFHRDHVGLSKVACAKETLNHLHVLGDTEITAVHVDAKQHWDQIVALSQTCTVIFNLIDQGSEWDVAVQSLALARNVPYVSGGTFQTTTTIDFCGPMGAPCCLCMGGIASENLEKLLPEHICTLKNLDFLKTEAMPIGASNIFVASTCSNLMLATWTEWVMHTRASKKIDNLEKGSIECGTESVEHKSQNESAQRVESVQSNEGTALDIPSRAFLYMNNIDISKWKVTPEKNCRLCSNIRQRLSKIHLEVNRT